MGWSVFLSYRRRDASGHVGRLYDSLAKRFGSDRVFIDVAAIRAGADFTEAIAEALASCRVMVVLIGRTWLTALGADGARRLEAPDDVVRSELEAVARFSSLAITGSCRLCAGFREG